MTEPTLIYPTTRIDALGIVPYDLNNRPSKYDLNREVKTPLGFGFVDDYFYTDGEHYINVKLPSGKIVTFPSIEVVTKDRLKEIDRDRNLLKSKAKAKKKGFHTDVVFFHGSPYNPFDAFDSALVGSRDHGWYGRGYYFSPILSVASGYGLPRAFYLRYKKPFRFKDSNISKIRDLLESKGITLDNWKKWLSKKGFDAVERYFTYDNKTWLEEVVILDSKNVRDVNAAFKNTTTSNLMD